MSEKISERYSGGLFGNQILVCNGDVLMNEYQKDWHKNNCANPDCPMKRVKGEVKRL